MYSKIFQWKNGRDDGLIESEIKLINHSTGSHSLLFPYKAKMNSRPNHFTFFKGRVALHAILRASGIGKGDGVLLPGYTCVVVPNSILFCQAKPHYIDIDPETYNINPNLLEDKLRDSPKGYFKALIVQHTYGIPCDMDALLDISKRYELLVIEDACHSLCSHYKGKQVGSFGDAAFFSSQWSKPLTTGLGGWAIVNNPQLVEKMNAILKDYADPGFFETSLLATQYLAFRMLYHPRLFWTIQSLYRKLGDLGLAIGSSTTGELACEKPTDYMKRMGKLQARHLDRLLDNLAPQISVRNKHAKLIEMKLKAAGFQTVDLEPGYDPVFLRYPVQVDNKNDLLANARSSKIQLGDWFLSPVHPNMTAWEMVGYSPGQCPMAEKISQKTINISTDNRNSEAEIERTVNFIKSHSNPGSSLNK